MTSSTRWRRAPDRSRPTAPDDPDPPVAVLGHHWRCTWRSWSGCWPLHGWSRSTGKSCSSGPYKQWPEIHAFLDYFVVLGQRGPTAVAVAAWLGWRCWRQRNLHPLLVLGASLLLLNITVGAAKIGMGRLGPHYATVVGANEMALGGDIFPSGHTANAVVTWGVLAYLATTPLRRRSLSVIAALGALGVGMTTVYLGTHWVSDVLLGWAAGLLVLLALPWMRARHHLGRGPPHGRSCCGCGCGCAPIRCAARCRSARRPRGCPGSASPPTARCSCARRSAPVRAAARRPRPGRLAAPPAAPVHHPLGARAGHPGGQPAAAARGPRPAHHAAEPDVRARPQRERLTAPRAAGPVRTPSTPQRRPRPLPSERPGPSSYGGGLSPASCGAPCRP